MHMEIYMEFSEKKKLRSNLLTATQLRGHSRDDWTARSVGVAGTLC